MLTPFLSGKLQALLTVAWPVHPSSSCLTSSSSHWGPVSQHASTGVTDLHKKWFIKVRLQTAQTPSALLYISNKRKSHSQ